MRGQFGTKLWVNEVHSKAVALDLYVGRRNLYASFLFWGALETRFEPKGSIWKPNQPYGGTHLV